MTYPATNSHPGSANPYAETEAMIAKYQQNSFTGYAVPSSSASDFAMLEDDDAQLPF